MNPATLIPGVALGLGFGFALHGIFAWLRRSRLAWPVAIIGWLCALATLWFSVLFFRAYLEMKDNPMASMGPFWGFLSAALALLLFIAMGLASWQRRRRPGTSWWQAFGFVMAEAGAAVGTTLVLNALRNGLIASFYRRGNDVGDILESFRLAREMLAYFQVTLAVAFILLALFGALPRLAPKQP